MLEGLAMASVSVFAGLVLLEGAARLRMPGNVFDPRFGLTAHQCCSLRIDLPGVSARGLLTTNRWGMRGEEPPDDWDGHTTIIAVGGSTTLDYFLDDSKTWAAVLQERLRKRIPLSGWATPAYQTMRHPIMSPSWRKWSPG
jgi:hypothetical protein